MEFHPVHHRRVGVLHLLRQVTDPLLRVVSLGYDTAGRLRSRSHAQGNVTACGYDGLGRRTGTNHPGGTTLTVDNDATDNSEQWIDANGAAVDQIFHAAGRPEMLGGSYTCKIYDYPRKG